MDLSASSRSDTAPYGGPAATYAGPTGGGRHPSASTGLSAPNALRGRPDGDGVADRGPEPSAGELRQAFQDFVGQTLFGSMLASMRATVGKPAYLHGGRTEEVFQKQLDQHLVENLSDATADTISDPMFELFQMQRRA